MTGTMWTLWSLCNWRRGNLESNSETVGFFYCHVWVLEGGVNLEGFSLWKCGSWTSRAAFLRSFWPRRIAWTAWNPFASNMSRACTTLSPSPPSPSEWPSDWPRRRWRRWNKRWKRRLAPEILGVMFSGGWVWLTSNGGGDPTSNALPSVTAMFVFLRNIPANMTVCTILFTGAPCDHLTFLTCSDQVVWCLVLEDLRTWNSSWKWSPTSLEVSKSNGATQIHRSAMHPRMASTCRWRTSWGNGPFKRVSLKPFERSGATDPTGTGWHRPYESNSSLASWGHGQVQFFRGCFWGRDKPCRA